MKHTAVFLTAITFVWGPLFSWASEVFVVEQEQAHENTSASANKDKELPTVYEYFAQRSSNNETLVGLSAESDGFMLNGKKIKIVSGAMHYFRIHPDQWRDRMKKLRAMGANTVETYVPWNLHEPTMGEFDFGGNESNNDMSMFLNVRRYLQIAQEEDLLVIFRPGPYICAEWDFGGLPSWLLRDPEMKIRTNYQPYLDRVKLFLDQVLPLVIDMQFTRGGPIIGIQLENEYGSFNTIHLEYMEFLYELFETHVNETFLFSTDTVNNGHDGTLPAKLFMTANFQGEVDKNFGRLRELQPNKPLMAMEFWAGWFDHWNKKHHTLQPGIFVDSLDSILGKWDGSVNFYMFHGGTNFGFMAGANVQEEEPYYAADATSYDYDSPLSECGDYTIKYRLAKTLIENYQTPRIRSIKMPPESEKKAYPNTQLQRYLTYEGVIAQVPESSKFKMETPVSMENLDVNNGSGQSYGYIIYRKEIERITNGTLFQAGPVKDFGILIVDGQLHPTGFHSGDYWINTTRNYTLNEGNSIGPHVLDLFIENTGRINYGNDQDFKGQRKGLGENATYKLDDEDIKDIEIISLEFKSKWVQSLTDWKPYTNVTILKAPVLVETTFEITDEKPADTFLDMSAWHKGIVFVNGFNVGRYFRVGPQQTLYVPGPLLHKGVNKVTIFEQFEPSNQIVFRDRPRLGLGAKEEWKVCRVQETE